MLSKKSDVTEEYINYIILLSALQVVYNIVSFIVVKLK
jgi:hypothetical protein